MNPNAVLPIPLNRAATGVMVPKVCSLICRKCIDIYTKTIDQECNGDQNTTANNKRKHVGYTIHQMLIDLMSYTAAGLFVTGRRVWEPAAAW